MYTRETLEGMTVVDLRKLARDNDISLGAGISKAGIVDRLCEALVETVSKPSEAAAPVRRAAIVTDDDDTPVLTPNVPYVRSQSGAATTAPRPVQRPVAAAPAPVPAARPAGAAPSKKPEFRLEGSRVWHNPREAQPSPSAGQRTTSSSYQPQRPPQRPLSVVSRFGPEASSAPAVSEPVSEPYERPAYQAPAYSNDIRAQGPETHIRREPVPATSTPQEMLPVDDIHDGSGILEIQNDGTGALRTGNYLPSSHDIAIFPAQIRRYHLHTGDRISGKIRTRHENEALDPMLIISEINGVHAEDFKANPPFDTLTAVYPTQQFLLSKKANGNRLLRTIDLLCPIGFGQRSLIIAPPRSGKSALLTDIAASIAAQNPNVQLISLLLGERPEDITVARDTLPGEVVYAGFDEPMGNHTRIAELTLARALRLSEQKKDVVLLIDSLTALCRAYSECAPQNVRILPGGLAAGSLANAKRLFGSARALREGGSLTIIAVMLADTGISLDQAISEEFRGTANMELYLSADGQIDCTRSLTRNADAMLTPEARTGLKQLRRMAESDPEGFTARLASLLDNTAKNTQLLQQLNADA